MNYVKFTEYDNNIHFRFIPYDAKLDPWKHYIRLKKTDLEKECDRRINCVFCEMENKLFKTYVNNASPGIIACDFDNEYVQSGVAKKIKKQAALNLDNYFEHKPKTYTVDK